MTAFNSKWKQEKLAVPLVVVGVCGHFAEDSYEVYKGLLNTFTQPLFCSLNLSITKTELFENALQTGGI